jgi:hypothetical protein
MRVSKYSRGARGLRHRYAKIVRRLRKSSMTPDALGAEYGLTRQRIQQIAKRAGITWERRRDPRQWPFTDLGWLAPVSAACGDRRRAWRAASAGRTYGTAGPTRWGRVQSG